MDNPFVCTAQDSEGIECGVVMSRKEQRQDDMCSFCADNIWIWLRTDINNQKEHTWYHSQNKRRNK